MTVNITFHAEITDSGTIKLSLHPAPASDPRPEAAKTSGRMRIVPQTSSVLAPGLVASVPV